ncbi:MAG: type III PLP-dependent enzyme [Pseudomonadota bacterium]
MQVHFETSQDVVRRLAPEVPVYCVCPRILQDGAEAFLAGFPGRVLYAVKANPMAAVLDGLYAGGLRHFDTASLNEIALISGRYPEAGCYFMHPVKGWDAIHAAYHRHGVRHFVVDHQDELDKHRQVLGGTPEDLVTVVRLATEGGDALFDLSGKFGAQPEEAARLLSQTAAGGGRVGLAFHVGSQCTAPESYARAFERVREVLARAPVRLDCLDVGGGFPVSYGSPVPSNEHFFRTIREGLERLALPTGCEVLCEPGRALVARGMSLITQIHRRRGDALTLNDGIYGSLRGATIGMRYPSRLLRSGGPVGGEERAFTIYGPTCDGLDVLPYEIELPAEAGPGDWIEFGLVGAYTNTLVSGFNGFRPDIAVTVEQGFAPAPSEAAADMEEVAP